MMIGKRCLDDRLVFGKTKPNPLMISTVLKEKSAKTRLKGASVWNMPSVRRVVGGNGGKGSFQFSCRKYLADSTD
jgi:hypothetical protein